MIPLISSRIIWLGIVFGAISVIFKYKFGALLKIAQARYLKLLYGFKAVSTSCGTVKASGQMQNVLHKKE